MIFDIVWWVFLVLFWARLGWFYKELRGQRRKLEEINDIIAETNRNLQWVLTQRDVLSVILRRTGIRGVWQMGIASGPDGPPQVVTVSITSNAVVISSPGEKEATMRMWG